MRRMKKFIDIPYQVNTIFVMLGFGCNFNCKYCMQSDYKLSPMKEEKIDECVDFIKYYSELAFQGDYPLQVNFFGGEPLMYFDKIKYIVNALKDCNVVYTVITNGSLISGEVLDFINDHNISVCISWDGRNTEYSRNVDVFKTNRENLFNIKNGFFVSGVMNSSMYPKEFFEDLEKLENDLSEYRGEEIKIGFNLDCLYNLGHENDVYNIDFQRLYEEIKEMSHNYIYDSDKNSKFANYYINELVNNLKGAVDIENFMSMCMNGIHTLNLDLNGNLHMCHDVDNKVLGTIYSDVESYMNNFHKYNNIAPDYYKNTCVNCEVRYLCNGGCSLISKEERDEYYCPQRKILFMPIIEELMKLK